MVLQIKFQRDKMRHIPRPPERCSARPQPGSAPQFDIRYFTGSIPYSPEQQALLLQQRFSNRPPERCCSRRQQMGLPSNNDKDFTGSIPLPLQEQEVHSASSTSQTLPLNSRQRPRPGALDQDMLDETRPLSFSSRPLNPVESVLQRALDASPLVASRREIPRTQTPAAALSLRAQKPFRVGDQLGEGAQGVVFSGQLEDSGHLEPHQIVLKSFREPKRRYVVNFSSDNPHAAAAQSVPSVSPLVHESFMHRSVCNPDSPNRFEHYIVSTLGEADFGGGRVLIMSRMDGGDLKACRRALAHLITHSSGLEDYCYALIYRMMLQALLALTHCSACHLVNGDIKDDNFLMDKEFNIFLSDFGASWSLDPMSPCKSKLPRVGNGFNQFRGNDGPESDIYALGHLLLALLGSETPEAIGIHDIAYSNEQQVVDATRRLSNLLASPSSSVAPEQILQDASILMLAKDSPRAVVLYECLSRLQPGDMDQKIDELLALSQDDYVALRM